MGNITAIRGKEEIVERTAGLRPELTEEEAQAL
jgi:hypothetical protein